jgi:hypothetical protein
MLRWFIEDIAALLALALFVATVAVWATILGG